MPSRISQLSVTGWKLNVTQQQMSFTEEMQKRGSELVDGWVKVFAKEDTWIQKNLGIPSLIVRLDCVGGCRSSVYEIEERPSGIGISQAVSSLFRANLNRLMKDWPQYDVVVSGERISGDDHLYGKTVLTLEEAQKSQNLLWVRAEPDEELFHAFEARSVSSLKQKGNKSYGVNLGLWTEVKSGDELPWETGFALKPRQGSKCRGVEIWTSERQNGKSTKTRIERVLSEHGSMYCQPLIYPMNTGLEQFPHMIFRVFYGYNILTSKWECMGGLWLARPNLKIHGATDSVVGPVALD